jgi:superfamily II DNA/RNA helicase
LHPTSFAELGLSAKVLAAIEATGYTSPTPIQAQAIPVAMTGRDVLGIAQTGTGKTAAFTMPMIARLEVGRARARMPRSLILAPTRELAAQVAQSFEKYGVNHKLNLALLIGGVSFEEQNAKLDRGVDVLIATPGRLLDQFQRGRVMLMGVDILVIDEADRMLDMGFIPDIEKICKLLPPKRQTLFFSATMPPEISRLVQQFMKEPVRIEVAPPATTAKTITQRFSFCEDGEDWAKRERLRELIAAEDVKNAIIFCNRKRDVAILDKSMRKHGFNAGALHGDMDQSSRTATLDAFRAGDLQYLVASDVAARGLDIPEVSHVFNFDMPWDADDYVHRIGRTGRAGREGRASSLVTLDDFKVLREIEKRGEMTAEWIGEAPSAEAEAEAASGRKRRGRGGAKSGTTRSSSRTGSRSREEASGQSPRAEGTRSRGGRTRRPAQPAPVEAGSMAVDTAAPFDAPADHSAPAAATARTPVRRRRGDAPRAETRSEELRREEGGAARLRPDDGPRAQPMPSAPKDHEDRAPRSSRSTPSRSPATDRAAAPRAPATRPAAERAAPPAPRTNADRDRRSPSAGNGGNQARGFEDNIPAFLRRPVRIASR